eukprot:2972386-Rhodomonas_salina.2
MDTTEDDHVSVLYWPRRSRQPALTEAHAQTDTLQCVTADEGQAWIHDVEKYARAAAVRRNLVKEDNQLERMQRR